MKRLTLILAIALAIASTMAARPAEMTIATYNLRQSNGIDSIRGNGWGQRAPYLAKLIQFHDFDIFGTQEGKYHQLQEMKEMMPEYDYIGAGRDDGRHGGEHSAIFFKPSRFEVLDHGDFWLSADTERPNLGWDAACVRICTWGKFRDKESGFTFVYFNLHMDHVGTVARAESAKLILERIKAFPEKLPVLLSGDFNVDQFNESYLLLQNSGVMADAYTTADFIYAPTGTFNNYKTDRLTDRRIDHIFLSPEFKVKKYGILTDTYRGPLTQEEADEYLRLHPDSKEAPAHTARIPSDHYPVVIKVTIPD